LRYCTGIYVKVPREKYGTYQSGQPVSGPRPPEYEAEVLTAR